MTAQLQHELPPALSPYGLVEEAVALRGLPIDQQQAICRREYPWSVSGQPWGMVVMGQALPPADGQPKRVYSAARYVINKQGNTLFLWDGPRRQVGPSALLAEFTTRPAWARVLDLSEPSPLKLTNWHSGIWMDQRWAQEAIPRIMSAFEPLKNVPLAYVVIDDESRFDPWALKRDGQWDAMLADSRLPKALAAAGISKADLVRIGAMPAAQAIEDEAWHRWCDYTHRNLALDLRTIGGWISEAMGADVPVLSTNHYHRIPSEILAERNGVYHAPRCGSGLTPSGLQCVKQYGLPGLNADNSAWGRFVADCSRMRSAAQASAAPVIALLQANIAAPQNGDPAWATSQLGGETIRQAAIVSGLPLLVSQAQNDPTQFPAECLAQQRFWESQLAELNRISSGMGCDYTWELTPWPEERSKEDRWVTTLADNGGMEYTTSERGIEHPTTPPVPMEPEPVIDPRDAELARLHDELDEIHAELTKAEAGLAVMTGDRENALEQLRQAKSDLAAMTADRDSKQQTLDMVNHIITTRESQLAKLSGFVEQIHTLVDSVSLETNLLMSVRAMMVEDKNTGKAISVPL